MRNSLQRSEHEHLDDSANWLAANTVAVSRGQEQCQKAMPETGSVPTCGPSERFDGAS